MPRFSRLQGLVLRAQDSSQASQVHSELIPGLLLRGPGGGVCSSSGLELLQISSDQEEAQPGANTMGVERRKGMGKESKRKE